MPANPGQQKKAAKQKKKRELARRRATPPPAIGTSRASLLRQAALLPHGPSFVSADFTMTRMDPPRLVSVVVTRKVPGGMLLPALALVDRTCLGVKNAFVAELVSEYEFGGFVLEVGRAHEGGLVPCELAVAQSIVWNAVDYAASLGFDPHPDFPEVLFGPRPAPLLDTPLAHPSKPFWVRGPDDDVEEILATLDESVGEGNYDVAMITGMGGVGETG
ncbi:Hypothetical protein A7982_08560 [Minicystis rosea]|nr:Hypothetical protein A7982_08560 [Minicystis rosea]